VAAGVVVATSVVVAAGVVVPLDVVVAAGVVVTSAYRRTSVTTQE